MGVTRSLVIAPQWIGDAVITEPLLRRLHARCERLAVGALPWVAPVYRVMPQVDEVIEFPFQHGGLQFKARRSIAKQVRGRFDGTGDQQQRGLAGRSGQRRADRRVADGPEPVRVPR